MTPEERVAKRIKDILQEENCVLTIRTEDLDAGRHGLISRNLVTSVKVVYASDPSRHGALLHQE